MKPKFFIGIDVSKATLDIAVLTDVNESTHFQIENTESSLVAFLGTLKKDFKSTKMNSFFCAEQMGIYNTFLKNICVKKKLQICLESPLHLKRTLGIQRGKNDKMDALRIAQYAQKNYPSLRLWQPSRKEIIELKTLNGIRRKLIKIKGMFKSIKTEENFFLPKKQRMRYDIFTVEILQSIEAGILQIE